MRRGRWVICDYTKVNRPWDGCEIFPSSALETNMVTLLCAESLKIRIAVARTPFRKYGRTGWCGVILRLLRLS